MSRPLLWQRVDAELALGLPAAPLASTSALVELLLSPNYRSSVIVQYVTSRPVEAEPAITIAERLDAMLAGAAG